MSEESFYSIPTLAPVRNYHYSSGVIDFSLNPILLAMKKLNTNLCCSNTARPQTLKI